MNLRRPARYLLRFDDLCPTMNWRVWERIEVVLQDVHSSPLLAVIPDNRDPDLMLEPAAADFWDRVRAWQERGWSIGLHGCQHLYSSTSAGLLGLNPRSEFAGLALARQEEKLAAALTIFQEQRVHPDFWVAPAHSFDDTTLLLLLRNGIEVISDGFSWRPYRELNMTWIPQQLWRFRSVPCGVWTVCLHHNRWGEAEFSRFERGVRHYQKQLTALPDLLAESVPNRTFLDHAFARVYCLMLKCRRRFLAAQRSKEPGG